MKNPCFDQKTKTDCPNRHPGCGATCEKWQEYTKAKQKVYENRMIQSTMNGYEVNRRQKIRKTLGKSVKQN